MNPFYRAKLLIAAVLLGSLSLARAPRAEEGTAVLVCNNTESGWENQAITLKLYYDDNAVDFGGATANASFGQDAITWQVPSGWAECKSNGREEDYHACQPSRYSFDRNSGYLDEFIDGRLPGSIRYACRRTHGRVG